MLALFTLWAVVSHAAASCPPWAQHTLQSLLSSNNSVNTAASPSEQRWSEYAAPEAALYVQVSRETDVSTVVRFANQHDYPFLLRNGGNGWADTFNLHGCSILIDISPFRQITFNDDRTEVHIQGGAGVEDMVAAAYQNNARLATSTCNCLGFLGAALGGGQTRTSGLYGLTVDQLISANVVLASGQLLQVSAESHPDLWWALGGAGPNFGIVTSATIKSYPIQTSENIAWQGLITFSDDKVEAVMQALNELELEPHMQFDTEFFTTGAPDYIPGFAILPFFVGNTSAAEAAFASILSLGPTSNAARETAYIDWNRGSSFCDKGNRKPAYGASLAQIDAKTWVDVYHEFKAFVASNPTAYCGAVVISENYPTEKALAIGGATSSYAFRHLGTHAIALPLYADASLDDEATAWAARIRSMWYATSGTSENSSYINFAHGDEPLSTIYGESLPRLQRLKQIYDPLNRFNQWFPLRTSDLGHGSHHGGGGGGGGGGGWREWSS